MAILPAPAKRSMSLSITFDLEDNRRDPAQPPRFVAMTQRFLDFLDEHGVKATVFVVGELGRSHPELVREVASRGHEIGLHGLRHVTLEDVGKENLREELREGKALLEDAAQAPVPGFRAPIFSLTPGTAWALDDIVACGFTYSSSVLPAVNPLHGWPGAPRTPFRWENGLIELPCPVAGAGRAMIPFLGGIYVRYVPLAISTRLLANLGPDALAWSYVHPYDLDPEEPFFVLPHAGWLTSRILHTRRGATLPRIERILAASGGAAPPLADRLEGIRGEPLPLVAQ
jgi:polysaccharide deacetylase family protein (PEP-CTERM system associated)